MATWTDVRRIVAGLPKSGETSPHTWRVRKKLIVWSGVGKATGAALTVAGHSVLIACRDVDKRRRAADEMTGEVEVAALDLGDLASVRAFAKSVKRALLT